MARIDLKRLLESMRTERAGKFASGLSNLQNVAQLFGPGYGKGMERSALATMEQSMVGRGLSGTTMPGALSVGIKSQIEDTRRARLADAMSNVSQYIQSGTPSASDVSHLATGGFSGLLAETQMRAASNQPRDIISGNQAGLGYQPPSGGRASGYVRKFGMNMRQQTGKRMALRR